MRKRMLLGSLLGLMVLAAGCGKRISMDEAKDIALKDAGLTSGEVTFTREQQDEGEYELRFRTEKEKFEYEVSRGGKIESKLREQDTKKETEREEREESNNTERSNER